MFDHHAGQLDFDPVLESEPESDAPDADSRAEGADAAASPRCVELTLRVRDPELVEELAAFGSRVERESFALTALRIGVLALRSARGQVDAQTVRGEVERMLGELREGLDQHRGSLQLGVEKTLRDYFDPRSGRFAERVEALTHADGELARVIRSQVEGSDSALVRTLSQHLGAGSPLLRLLDPASAGGLVPELTRLVQEALGAQRERILSEFSLDNREGSLARLVAELRQNHGELADGLRSRIDDVVKEFSLDQEDSALSRLVQRVERAQRQITEEFTLDSETSSLARLRRELMSHVERQTEAIAGLERRVAAEMAAHNAKRQAEARGTAHGTAFEQALLEWLERSAREAGDVFIDTSQQTGLIRHRKVGDAVIELGPEHQAAGARIAVEAKEEASCTPALARQELELARKNRGAELGIFVLSARSASASWPPFRRVGSDIFVVWDPEDVTSDVFLDAALSVARTLCTRSRTSVRSEVDLPTLERAIREVEKQTEALEEVRKAAETIESGTNRIQQRVRVMREHLLRAVAALDRSCEAVRRELGEQPGP